MKIMSWNWGLRNQCAVDVLSHLVREKALKILFLMETKQSVLEMKKIQEGLPYRSMFAVPSIRWSGGLALLWMEEIDLHVQNFTLNHIDVLIMDDMANLWRLTGSMDGLRSNESRIHGNSWNISTLDTWHPGFALGILMRSCNQKRSKVDYQSHWPQCSTFERCFYIADWDLGFRGKESEVISLLGIMVVRRMIMCKKDWTGHAPRRNGEISSLIAMSLTYKQRILIIYQYSSPHNPEADQKEKNTTTFWREMGHSLWLW